MNARQVLFLIVLITCSAAFACASGEPALDNTTLKEIERLWQAVPVYPGMVEVGGPIRPSEGQVTKKYNSDARLSEVKAFYTQKLSQVNWKFAGENELKHNGMNRGERLLRFDQGNYRLDIRYNGERKSEFGSDYLISISPRS